MDTLHTPLLGVAYYPEDWDESEQIADIAKMKEAGINAVRIAEFAWRCMEPKEGEFDFGWLHRVMDRLHEAGIAIILGTPSATPPIWLVEKYPDMFLVDAKGHRAVHGGRRHCCSNNEHYRTYSARIARKMAQEFGRHPGLIGWQIDNEINGEKCCCPVCTEKFHRFLERKYGTVENLNRQWNLTLFSQAYDNFDQIPIPVNGWQNPHVKLEWTLFHGESHIEFIHMQADELRPYTDAPIGTDLMHTNWLDYEKMNEKLDVFQTNHYEEKHNMNTINLWYDYIRPLKDRPFWSTETSTCWNGATAISQNLKPEGFCRVNSWLPIALGGEANFYWLWRTHWAGHELNHGSVLAPSGRPLHILGEVQEVADGYRKAADFLSSTKITPDIALHFSSLNWNLLDLQPIVDVPGRSYNLWKSFYHQHLQQYFYLPFQKAGARMDVIGAGRDLSRYKLLISGLMLTMEEKGEQERVAEWVRNGGVWLVGPMTDIRNAIGAHYKDREMGMVEELTGITLRYSIPDHEDMITASWSDGSAFRGDEWYQLYEGDGESLVTVTGGHSAIVGKSLVMAKKVGKGLVILVGTFPSEEDCRKIVQYALAQSGASFHETTGDVTVVPRQGGGHEGLVLVETACEPASCKFEGTMTDLLTGIQHAGEIQLEPYQIAVLEK